MAKNFDLSTLRKQPLKKKTPPNKSPEDLIVDAIHQEEPSIEEPKLTQKIIRKPTPTKESVKRVTLDLPASLHTKLKLYAVTNQTTIRNIVIEVLEQILE